MKAKYCTPTLEAMIINSVEDICNVSDGNFDVDVEGLFDTTGKNS